MRKQLPDHMSRTDRDRVAAGLSILPGLGQLYKRHYALGLGLMLIGLPCVLWMSILLALATFGLSLGLPLMYMFLVGFDAYELDDWHPDVRDLTGPVAAKG